MERIEIVLAQGWAKGLIVAFENAADSAALERAKLNHVKQVHGRELVEITPEHDRLTHEISAADGLYARDGVARDCRKPLAVKSADCLPLIYVDHRNEAIAALHAGWRGLAQGIHRAPFERKLMDPKTTWVWVGPSLNGANFEVGADLWTQFAAYQNDERLFRPGADPDRRFFYVWDYLDLEMERLGVELVYNVGVDTFSDERLNSYRRLRRSDPGATSSPSNISWVGFHRP